MVSSLNDRMKEFIADPKITEEELTLFAETIRENRKLAQSKLFISLYFLVISSAIWYLIKTAAINKISFVGIEIGELSTLYIILPPITAFFYYRYALNVALADSIKILLDEYYSQKHKPAKSRNLIEFTEQPNFLNIEWIFLNQMDADSLSKKIGGIWTYLLTYIFAFLPLLPLLWMSYNMITSPVVGLLWSLISIIIVLVLIVRSHWILIETSKL